MGEGKGGGDFDCGEMLGPGWGSCHGMVVGLVAPRGIEGA